MASSNLRDLHSMGRRAVFMVNSIPITLLTGLILGLLAGMGVGGGSLLILWLTFIQQMDYDASRTVNLLFFLPAGIIASWFNRKQGALQYNKILPAILAGILSAALFSILRRKVDTEGLKTLFGILLLITGIRELLYRPRKDK